MQKTGLNSGYLARVMPILCYDREVVRLQQDNLPSYSFSLDGLKKAFCIFESKFSRFSAKDIDPPITLEFSDSVNLYIFRSANHIVTSYFRHNGNSNLCGTLTTLLYVTAPSADTFLDGTGVGRLRVFLSNNCRIGSRK